MTYDEFLKPNFNVEYWLRHFRGLEYDDCRAYEAFITSPISSLMCFADNMEYLEDYVDLIDQVPPNFPVEQPEIMPISFNGQFDIEFITDEELAEMLDNEKNKP